MPRVELSEYFGRCQLCARRHEIDRRRRTITSDIVPKACSRSDHKALAQANYKSQGLVPAYRCSLAAQKSFSGTD